MKQFITVLKFELANYIKNRTYMVTTILMAVVLGALMFLPRVLDLTGLVGESQGSVYTYIYCFGRARRTSE